MKNGFNSPSITVFGSQNSRALLMFHFETPSASEIVPSRRKWCDAKSSLWEGKGRGRKEGEEGKKSKNTPPSIPAYSPGRLRVKFVYEGHSIKVKVTEAKRTKISNREMQNLLRFYIEDRAVKFTCMVFGCGGSNGVNAIFVTWLGVTRAN